MRHFLGTIVIAALISIGVGALAPDRASGRDQFRVVFSADVFASVNKNDALASTKAWIRTVGQRRAIDWEVHVDAYDGPDELRRLVDEQGADLFIVNSMHYLDLESEQTAWDPLFVPQQGDWIREQYLLLVQADQSGGVPALRGASVLMLETTGAKLGGEWLNYHLGVEELGTPEAFFGSVETATKPSTAILPVFFGQAEACVVDRSSFDLMVELNPQIGTKLKAVAVSEAYLEAVLCLHRDYHQHRQKVLDGMSDLHDESAGQQMMMVFKIDRLVPFEPEQLETVRALREADRSALKAATQ